MMLFLALPISASTQMQKMTVISASDVDSVLHGIRCGAVVDRWHHASLPDSFSRVLYAPVSIDSIILLHIKQPTIRTDFKWPVTYAHNHASLLLNQSETCKCYQHCTLLQHIAMNLLGLHRIWSLQIWPGPDLGLQIRPGPGPGLEPNVLELEFIHSTFICYCLHIQTKTRMWVWPTCPWWNREVQITKFVKQWIPAQLHSEADASKDGQIQPHIRLGPDIKIWPDFGRGRIWYPVQP